MTDIPQPGPAPRLAMLWKRTDKAVLVIALLLAGVLLVAPGDLPDILRVSASALLHTAPFIAFAVLAVAGMKATGAERLVARAFEGRESRMIVMAAVMGGLAPFCSCEIIPFIAALLALGAPLSAVMALWLASPLMDPAMFAVTAGAIGLDFALAKTAAAIGIGMAGGFIVMAFARSPVFADPLREQPVKSGCCSRKVPFSGAPVWRFWTDPERRATFATTARTNAAFLLKWLALAYVLEAMMLRYVPAGWIAGVLGGEGIGPILLGAAVGGPAYLNGYAAVPLVGGLLEQGMSQGAAMSFVIAGGVSCIPAAVAVWALVRPRVFVAYLGIGLAGAVVAGLAWSAVA